MSKPTTIPGACNCKAVKFTLTIDPNDPPFNSLCHCTTCRRGSGSMFTALMFVTAKHFVLDESSKSALTTWEDHTPESGNTLLRNFCKTCGSVIYAQHADNQDRAVVSVAALDLPPKELAVDGWKYEPGIQMWCKNRPTWLENLGAQGKSFDAMRPH